MKILLLLAAASALTLLLGCTAETDRRLYAVGDGAVATFENASRVDVHLDGCSPFRFQRRVDDVWADYGLGPICLQSALEVFPVPAGFVGFTEVVPPGGRTTADFSAPDEPGVYRLRFPTGLRCEEGEPLSDASCRSIHPVDTPPFSVAGLCDPGDFRECGPQPLMPNFLCPDGVHAAGPTGRCLRNPETLACGWEILGCPD